MIIITQLSPGYPVIVTSKNNAEGIAIAWIESTSLELDTLWRVVITSGEVWDVPNKEILMQHNWSLGRR